ncbi:MAG TPA: hypothetical protein VM889_04165 [Candidatus Thermoplasmatota archaeon]|nr:hypothetical protein [Candidatus Thermoplasmatota archaeon]
MRPVLWSLVAAVAVVAAAFPAGSAHGGEGDPALVLSNVAYAYHVVFWEGWSGPTNPECGQNGICSPLRPHGVFTFDVLNHLGENLTSLGATFTIRAGVSASQSVNGLGPLSDDETKRYRVEAPVFPAPQFCVSVSGKGESSGKTHYSNSVCVVISGVEILP